MCGFNCHKPVDRYKTLYGLIFGILECSSDFWYFFRKKIESPFDIFCILYLGLSLSDDLVLG